MKYKQKYPLIFILNEKHGNYHYLITDETELYRVSLAIVKRRLEEDYWYYDDEDPTPLDFKEEDIPNMPKSLQESALKRLKEYENELRYFSKDKTKATNIVKDKNGKAAFNFLQDRGSGEYEGYELESFDKI